MSNNRRPRKKVSHALRSHAPVTPRAIEHLSPDTLLSEISSRAMDAPALAIEMHGAELGRAIGHAFSQLGVVIAQTQRRHQSYRDDPGSDLGSVMMGAGIREREARAANPLPPTPEPASPLQPGAPALGKRKIVL